MEVMTFDRERPRIALDEFVYIFCFGSCGRAIDRPILLMRYVPVRWSRLAIAAVLLIVLLLGGRTMLRTYRSAHADFVGYPSQPISLHPESTGVAGLQAVSIPTVGGIPIAGWYAPSRNCAAVILLHGTHTDRSSLLYEQRLLSAAGFGTLAFDWPGYGQSHANGLVRWGATERNALASAVTWIAKQSDVEVNRIGAYGYSFGAYVLAQVAAADARIHAVALGAVPSEIRSQIEYEYRRWGLFSELAAFQAVRDAGMAVDTLLPIMQVASISPRPLLIISSDSDGVVPLQMERSVFAAARAPKQFLLLHGVGHGAYARADSTRYGAGLQDFFEATLVAPSLRTVAVNGSPLCTRAPTAGVTP